MTHLQRSALSLGALAPSAGALTLVAPPAAHAVAAALVQVTNTAANPAIVEGADREAAQQVDLLCETYPGTNGSCTLLSGAGQGLEFTYTVPANQSLMATSADINSYSNPTQCNMVSSVTLTAGANARKACQITGILTNHYSYPSGFLISPGQTAGVFLAGPCSVNLELHGYLTSN